MKGDRDRGMDTEEREKAAKQFILHIRQDDDYPKQSQP